MKFYLIEAEDKNPIPWAVNKNNMIDIRDICRERFHRLPERGLVEMEIVDGLFFPPVLSEPFFLLSKDYVEVVNMYDQSIDFHYVKLFCENNKNATYFIPLLPETDCLVDECKGKPVLKEIIVKSEIVRDHAIQRIKGFSKSYVLVRMDLAESMLQRGAFGLRLTEVTVV